MVLLTIKNNFASDLWHYYLYIGKDQNYEGKKTLDNIDDGDDTDSRCGVGGRRANFWV